MVWGARRHGGQQDQFDWFSAYLDDRGLQVLWRAATGGCTLILAALPVALLWSPVGPDTRAGILMSVVAAVLGTAGALLWLARWPTRRQSLLFSLTSITAIATTCLVLSNPYSALMGCTTFAVIGGFVAYFHTLDEVLVTVGVAAVCAAVLVTRLVAQTGDVALAIAALLTVVILNVGVPFGIQSLVHALRTDLRGSDRDPLTGLHNRRSFHQSAYELMMRHQRPGSYLVIAMIDLDNFKHLNDTQGHAAGDAALIGVGEALEENCRHSAVIGRVGGEEFVVADIQSHPEPPDGADRLRRAISAAAAVTASIGTARASLASPSGKLIEELIRAADTAMYEAKRAGGDRVCHHRDVLPLVDTENA